MFVPAGCLQTSAMFVKGKEVLKGASLLKALALLANIRLGW
jgi:hypothetical protein